MRDIRLIVQQHPHFQNYSRQDGLHERDVIGKAFWSNY
jgi:hypothetical protein